MASGFFVLLDDIASLMDSVVSMSKVATKKTAGILGDDLAVNAEKATGFVSNRELPVLWAIAKGSFVNKLIILPIAFLLSAFLPIAVVIILVLGGLFLAYEGVEKIVHYLFHRHDKNDEVISTDSVPSKEEILEIEKTKIKSAITTDFILSVEIVIIALGTVLEQSLAVQIMTVSVVAILATVGVYGIVALIVRMDDFGLQLIKYSKGQKGFSYTFGSFLVKSLPWVIKSFTVIGTIALLIVAGGIFTHKIDFLHGFLHQLPAIIQEFTIGLLFGILVFFLVKLVTKVYQLIKK